MKNELNFDFYPDWALKLVVDEQSEIGSDFKIVRDPIGKKIVDGQDIFSFLQQKDLLKKSLNIYDLNNLSPRIFFNEFIKNGIYSIVAWNSLFESKYGKKYFPSAHFYKEGIQIIFTPLSSKFIVEMSPIFVKN